jgi:ArsR family transcriptional regulator
MSKYKKKDFVRLSRAFGALSNPNRLAVFRRILSCRGSGPRCERDSGLCSCMGEVGRKLRISPSTLSHHVKELDRNGLIDVVRRGKRIECSVNRAALKELARFFGARAPAAKSRCHCRH